MKLQIKTHTKYALTLAVATALAGLALPLQAQQYGGSSSPGSTESSPSQSAGGESAHAFLKQAQINSEFERQAAELGTQKAQNPQLKQLAQQMEQQSSQKQQRLQALAQQQGLPSSQPLPQHLAKELSNLKQQSGESFDKSYATTLLRQNSQSLKRTQQAMQQIQNPQVKQFAQNLQQRQQQQLQQTAQAAREVGVDQSTIAEYTQPSSTGMGGGGEFQGQSQGGGSSQQPYGGSSSPQGGGTSQQP